MKAYIIKENSEYPEMTEIANPEPAENQAIVKLTASSLNHRDIWITKGLYPGIKFGSVMGADGCGTCNGLEFIINPGLSWGASEAFQGKDFRVLGVPDNGTFADYIAIDKTYLYPKPAHLNDVQAAALPLAGVTAYRSLMVRGQLKKGEKVLISGIGGGVAVFALQYAVALGCEVFVTSGSESKISKALELGAKAGFSYNDPDWPKKLLSQISGIDVVIDSACGPGFQNLVKVSNPGARIVFYGGTAGKIEGLNPQPVFWRQISLLGSTMGSPADFKAMIDFVTEYKITPVIDSVLPFDQLNEGFKKMAKGDQFGKIVFHHE